MDECCVYSKLIVGTFSHLDLKRMLEIKAHEHKHIHIHAQTHTLFILYTTQKKQIDWVIYFGVVIDIWFARGILIILLLIH